MTIPPDRITDNLDAFHRVWQRRDSASHLEESMLFVSRRSDDEPPRWFLRLFVAFVIINAAAMAAYLIASK
jgi:hypothetical protein